MGNKYFVNILWCGEKHKVVPAIVEVEPGDTIEFFSLDSRAKISFPDSWVVDIDSWVTIEKGDHFEVPVTSKAIKEVTYYYTVMCEHEKGYWYGQGNSCPGMKVR